MSGGIPGPRSASELAAKLRAEREATPFVMYRDGDDALCFHALRADAITIGRDPSTDLSIGWDPEVSRVHAELVRLGDGWVLDDQGLSRNGTFLNGSAVSGRRRIDGGDVLRVGQTVLVFSVSAPTGGLTTVRSAPEPSLDRLTRIQREILAALCRPLLSGAAGATPASNREIADAVHLSVEGVKSQLRTLTELFGYRELPQNRKRLALAERAIRAGLGGR